MEDWWLNLLLGLVMYFASVGLIVTLLPDRWASRILWLVGLTRLSSALAFKAEVNKRLPKSCTTEASIKAMINVSSPLPIGPNGETIYLYMIEEGDEHQSWGRIVLAHQQRLGGYDWAVTVNQALQASHSTWEVANYLQEHKGFRILPLDLGAKIIAVENGTKVDIYRIQSAYTTERPGNHDDEESTTKH